MRKTLRRFHLFALFAIAIIFTVHGFSDRAAAIDIVNPGSNTVQNVTVCSTNPSAGQLFYYGGSSYCGATNFTGNYSITSAASGTAALNLKGFNASDHIFGVAGGSDAYQTFQVTGTGEVDIGPGNVAATQFIDSSKNIYPAKIYGGSLINSYVGGNPDASESFAAGTGIQVGPGTVLPTTVIDESRNLYAKGLQLGTRTVTASGAIASTDYFLACNATSAAVNMTLPAATGSGRKIIIDKIDSSANACGLVPYNTDLINGTNATVGGSTRWTPSRLIDYGTGTWASW